MLNAKLIQLWIDALNSGKYKQAFGSIKYKDSYCAVGVLGVVMQENSIPDEEAPANGFLYYISKLNDRRLTFSQIAQELSRYVPKESEDTSKYDRHY